MTSFSHRALDKLPAPHFSPSPNHPPFFSYLIWTLFVLLSGISPHLSSNRLYAQESKVKINYEGKDFIHLKHAWKAQWMTYPVGVSTLDYGVFLFRKTFHLPVKPRKFVIYVSADNRYKLYINGVAVSEGPARGDINHWRYETLDIAPFLRPGKNVIAARVVNFGEFRHGAQQSFQTAFILQGDNANPADVNTGKNSGWKVIHDEGYHAIPFTSDSVGGYYVAGPGDYLDGSHHPWGWEQIQFDDTHWKTPRAATVEFAVGRGFLFGSTWYLVPRMIPPLSQKLQRFDAIVRQEGMPHSPALAYDLQEFVRGNRQLVIPPNSNVTLLFDMKTHTVGFPQLTVSHGNKSEIKMTYSEALFIKASHDRTAHAGWKKGHRDQLDGQEVRGYYDIFLPDGGSHRGFAPLALRTFRYIKMEIQTRAAPLTLEDFHQVYTAYPFEEKAKFTTGDSTLSKIWSVARRTLFNSSYEVFQDPYYEQLQYVGDARIESLVSLYLTGDDRLMRKAIQSFDDSRLPMGLTQSRFPSYIVQVIPTYSLLWVDMIDDFRMYRNDSDFLAPFIPGVIGVLRWFERHLDTTGMLANLEWWNFTDWTKGFQNGIPPGTDDGHSANVSLQYVYALQRGATLCRSYGYLREAKHFQALAKSVSRSTLQHCFDKDKGLIAERPEKDVFSQHTNIFAILTDAIPMEQQPALMQSILRDTGLIACSVYFRFYLHRAMEKTGLGNRYLTMLQPWTDMLEQGMTTFGETDKNPRSECHAWSATPCFDALHLVAGIRPLSAGFKEVLIEPSLGNLPRLQVLFPHPEGDIRLHITRKKKDTITVNVVLPKGITGLFRWGGKVHPLTSGPQSFALQKD